MNLPQLTPRQRKIAKWAGYPLLALFTFIITLHITFPYERAKGWLEEQASDKYDVKIKDISPNILPGGVTLTTVKIRPRPKKADDTPPAITIDELEADVSLFGLLRGRLDVDIEATLGKGSVSGEISSSKAGLNVDLSTKKLPLQHVPGVKEAVGLPMEGGLNLEIAIWLPRSRWREADGKIKLSCPSCTVGDGVAKIKPKPREGSTAGSRASAREQFIGEGIEVPRLDLGNLSGQIDIKSGKGVIKNFRGESVDGEMLIEGDIEFKDPFKLSSFPGCMKFKFTPDFHTREPKFANVPNLMGAGIQPDGFAHVRLSGTLGDLKWKPRLKCSEGGTGPEGEGSDRPVVTTRPEPTAAPPAAGEQPPQPAQPDPSGANQPPPPPDAAVPEPPPNGERPRGIDDVKPVPPEVPLEERDGEQGGQQPPPGTPGAPGGDPPAHDSDGGQ